MTGSVVALFLWSLEQVTSIRLEHGWLLFLLPVGGALIGLVYKKVGRSVEAGNNLIVEEIHEPSGGIPRRMAPLVFIATIVTHLFGGSAGREGTAVQLGGSIASFFARLFGMDRQSSRIMLMAGIACGFGAVFGTPLAGAVFALEVLTIGSMEYSALIPCLMAGVMGDIVCRAWGVHHMLYQIPANLVPSPRGFFQPEWWLIFEVAVASILFGLASVLFAEMAHGLGRFFKRTIKQEILRPFVGGVIIIGLTYLIGSRDYLGMGEYSTDPHSVTIVSAFHLGGATPFSWFWKLLLTAVTQSSGFKGGQVTPLFFIGATLGNLISVLFHSPPALFAALGFVAVFAGATNTPLACTIMSVELFGSEYLLYFAIACFLSYFFSSHSGIYRSQRVAIPRDGLPAEPDKPSSDTLLGTHLRPKPSMFALLRERILGPSLATSQIETSEIASSETASSETAASQAPNSPKVDNDDIASSNAAATDDRNR